MFGIRKQTRDEVPSEEERGALQTFERILEIMPDDRVALEAAILAAHACGERDKALSYRLRLGDLLVATGDTESLREHVEILRQDDDLRAKGWVEAYDLKQRTGSAARPAAESPEEVLWTPEANERSNFNISEEIELAWKLFEHREITQEDYSGLVRDLTEMSASHNGGTVSVLHALEAGQHKSQDRILAFLAQESEEQGMPYVSLSCFTMRPELAQMLPLNFVIHRGAIIFEVLGRERLVAVLNPFSQALRTDVEHISKAPCHFYMTRASEFDEALGRLKEVAASSEVSG